MPQREHESPAGNRPGSWAVLRTGGKQYVVRVGDRLSVDRSDFLAAVPPDSGGRRLAAFDDILLLGSDSGTLIGSPNVPNARVIAELLPERRSPKVVAFKKRRRKNSRTKRGHRQILQPLVVVSIDGARSLSLLEFAGMGEARPGPPSGHSDSEATVRDVMQVLAGSDTEEAIASLGRLATMDWQSIPDWKRWEYARAIEPWLTAADPRARAASVLAMAAAGDEKPGPDTAPEKVASALNRHFAKSRRRHFARIELRASSGTGTPETKGGAPQRYQAIVCLRDRLDLPAGNTSVLLPQGGYRSGRVHIVVSGSSVDPGSTRVIDRRGGPAGTMVESVVEFTGDPHASSEAVLDVVVGGRRIERRFLNLAKLEVSRTPPAGRAPARSVPTAYGDGLTTMSQEPDQGSARMV